jgi:hypothetical protein
LFAQSRSDSLDSSNAPRSRFSRLFSYLPRRGPLHAPNQALQRTRLGRLGCIRSVHLGRVAELGSLSQSEHVLRGSGVCVFDVGFIDFDSDPVAVQFLRGFYGRPAATERVAHDVTWVAPREDVVFWQAFREHGRMVCRVIAVVSDSLAVRESSWRIRASFIHDSNSPARG